MAGHHVTVYEASHQIGGRILTYRVPDKGYITELGAMRLPLKQHRLTNIYVTERYKLKVTPFLGYDPNTHYYVNGHRRTFNERIVPDDVGFDVYDTEKNKVRFPRMFFLFIHNHLYLKHRWGNSATKVQLSKY
jgi:monoamine oxidase